MINGYYPSKLVLYDSTGLVEMDSITLDLCGEGGMAESWTAEDSIVKQYQKDSRIETHYKGVRYHYALDFGRYSSHDNTENILKIINWFLQNNQYIRIYPRSDISRFKWVYMPPEVMNDLQLKLINRGSNSKGFQGLNIKVSQTTTQAGLDWINTNDLTKNIICEPVELNL